MFVSAEWLQDNVKHTINSNDATGLYNVQVIQSVRLYNLYIYCNITQQCSFYTVYIKFANISELQWP